MRTKYPFHVMKMDDVYVAASIGSGERKFNGYLRMNESTAIVVKMLQEDVTEDEIFAALKDEYTDSTEQEIRANLATILNRLDSEGLLIR